MHCSGPVSDGNEMTSLHCFAHTKNATIYLGIKNLLLEFLQDAVVGCPQHIVDLGHLVQLIGSREERIQTETEGNYKQQSYLHSFLSDICKACGGRWDAHIQKGERESEGLFSF